MTTNKDSIATGENTESKTAATPETTATEKKTLYPKRIGLIGLTLLLVIGIGLMPIRLSQNEVKAAEPITATVVATTFGKFLVSVITTWLIERALDAATKKDLEDNGGITLPTGDDAIEARAWVSGAYWIGASYDGTRKVDSWDSDNERWTGNWTTTKTTASQGDYWLTNPVGRYSDGKAMSTTTAKLYLPAAKYSTKEAQIELFDSDGWWLADVWVHGRADAFEKRKAVKLKQLKKYYYDAVYWGHEFEIFTQTWNVEDYNYKMNGQWDDDGWISLGHADAIDKDANEYEGLLYWKYQKINETGYTAGYTDDGMNTWQAPEENGREIIEFDSYRPEIEYYTACEPNQTLIKDPHISDDINRTFEDQGIFEKRWLPDPLWNNGVAPSRPYYRPRYSWQMVQTGTKRVVVHYGETDYTIN